jgi:predicted GIY-YIG superfamily endonuclease
MFGYRFLFCALVNQARTRPDKGNTGAVAKFLKTFETNTLVFYQKVESGNRKVEKLCGETGRQRFSFSRQRKMIFLPRITRITRRNESGSAESV